MVLPLRRFWCYDRRPPAATRIRTGNVGVIMSDLLLDDLRDLIARRQAVVIVGAGVAIGATNRAEAASWPGLLKDGVGRCIAVVPGLPAGWGQRVLSQIESGDL